ncbi:GntR family transcriptional regulator [Streptomyces narbonensis]
MAVARVVHTADRTLTGRQLASLLTPPTEGRFGYRELARAVREALLDGRVALRLRLPAERELATVLAVSRTTVTGRTTCSGRAVTRTAAAAPAPGPRCRTARRRPRSAPPRTTPGPPSTSPSPRPRPLTSSPRHWRGRGRLPLRRLAGLPPMDCPSCAPRSPSVTRAAGCRRGPSRSS